MDAILLMQTFAFTFRARKRELTCKFRFTEPLRHDKLAAAFTLESKLVSRFQHSDIRLLPIVSHKGVWNTLFIPFENHVSSSP